MNQRRKILFASLAMMTAVSLIVGGIAVCALYRAAFNERVERLQMMVHGQTRVMEAVARFDAIHSQEDHPQGASEATLSQIVDAHVRLGGFGETGEFVLGRREGERIVFLLKRRFAGLKTASLARPTAT